MLLKYVNINGKLIEASNAVVSHDNRAFRYGYGLFETMLVQEEEIALWAYHADRLFAGMKQLLFEIPVLFTQAWLLQEIIKTVQKNKAEKLCRVRLQVYAGSGGIFDATIAKPGYVIECFGVEPAVSSLNENGLVVGIAAGLNKSTDSLANLKTCNALVYAMAGRQAQQQKWNDSLILNQAGRIIESAIANIFWIKGETVYTPPLAEGCVAGVMRRHVLQLLTGAGVAVAESVLTVDTLMAADEVFLTNAIKKLRWVKSIGDNEYGNAHIAEIARMVY